jgi:low affinity Fe/Cu permease
MHERFRRLARRSSEIVGSAEMFLAACVAVIAWAVLGPRYGFSDTWQLVINTGTTIVTFLMVFIIQNAQNRDARAIQLKLDELIRAVKGARTGMVRLEEMTDQELCALAGDFPKLRSRLAAAHQESSGPQHDQTARSECDARGLREHGVVGQPGPPAPGNNYRIFPQELLSESTKASQENAPVPCVPQALGESIAASTGAPPTRAPWCRAIASRRRTPASTGRHSPS